jgi:hypothetical protein
VRRWIARCGALLIAAPVLVFALAALRAQRADYGWSPALARPTFASTKPLVVFDQAHNNASTADWWGRYWPFARLLAADGYDVRKGRRTFAPASLDGAQVLVVVNAAGAPKPQAFGINLPIGTNRDRGQPAFSATEVEVVRRWVEGGGALLLVADHAPMGSASAPLAQAFGVKMHAGFVEVPGENSDPLVFSAENGRLGRHPILSGSGPETAVRRVMTFTGQSLEGPAHATALLQLPAAAIEYAPDASGSNFRERPAGSAQGLAMTYGRGRVVVLGEAAMLTAQVDGGRPFGMNLPDNENKQLALNIMHWLSGRI